jgi:hypothetical protein
MNKELVAFIAALKELRFASMKLLEKITEKERCAIWKGADEAELRKMDEGAP